MLLVVACKLVAWCRKATVGHRISALHISGVVLLLLASLLPVLPVQASPIRIDSHTVKTGDENCSRVGFSPSGNPFPICPGPYPVGGNCVWWAWEQWHLLGYDLPRNWGNAADWVVDAQRSGLPMGTTPRVGAIAVFPRADGVWAYGLPGHVAFVTNVYPDGQTFDVTYQNYGDPTPMYVGRRYNAAYINQPQYQNGRLRFIYFPREIDLTLFAHLPGINGNPAESIAQANQQLMQAQQADTSKNMQNKVALGLSPASSDQEYNADFTGTGTSDLLLYNRKQGTLKVLHLAKEKKDKLKVVELGDSITPAGKWGPMLDVHLGDFDGSGTTDILLYERNTGKIHLLALTRELKIKQHAVLNGEGPGWEVYAGKFDGKRSALFMYHRLANPSAYQPGPTETQPTPSVTPTQTPTASPTKIPSPTPSPTKQPTATPSVKPTQTPTPSPTQAPSPTPTTKPSPSPTVKPSPTPTAKPSPTPSVKPTATVTPTPTTVPGLKATPSITVPLDPTVPAIPTPTVSPTLSSIQGSPVALSALNATLPLQPTNATTEGELSESKLQEWEKQGRQPNVILLDFDKDLKVQHRQVYTLWHSSWEVYTGRFLSHEQDGVFLYDRISGKGRMIGFNDQLGLRYAKNVKDIKGNWMVYSGDFLNTGRAQLLLYDPENGHARILGFNPKLTLEKTKTFTDWDSHLVLYVGHFGTPALGVMLYDPQEGRSTFMTFDASLQVKQMYVTKSWDERYQILIGAFVDRSHCTKQTEKECLQQDAILVLNRETGKMQYYVFSFGRKVKVFDNRVRAFERHGIASEQYIETKDTTTFDLISTIQTSIKDEELY
ncbi:CHAP domain-containing protein [Thermosporothrix hazakensis]|uniref:CHAP domain-containing protein n=1 Tax=Thermosporothrix hazakensis TaxID=644383 RepID=A0A326UC24_THEHA|nr:CHAP domain-containing protein [Thermosporothrix hazakensis]PZW36172.1 CHAP domain-containing protein [Thermosporothrix hazakensis]GCE46822.1 hypothetical protein KTH_16910 [Thermosporothrix hazakensis]